MSLAYGFTDVGDMAKLWLTACPVAALVTDVNGVHIYNAMPLGSPARVITVARVGGGPPARSDIPYDQSRLSFQCWSDTRSSAHQIAQSLMTSIVNLSEVGGFPAPGGLGRLHAGEVINLRWLPDPDADIPRFIVDAIFVSTAA